LFIIDYIAPESSHLRLSSCVRDNRILQAVQLFVEPAQDSVGVAGGLKGVEVALHAWLLGIPKGGASVEQGIGRSIHKVFRTGCLLVAETRLLAAVLKAK
jgi:hypothetical protein